VEEVAHGEASGWEGAAYVGPAGDWYVDGEESQGGWSDGEGSQECLHWREEGTRIGRNLFEQRGVYRGARGASS
jgi:hypothetical protein